MTRPTSHAPAAAERYTLAPNLWLVLDSIALVFVGKHGASKKFEAGGEKTLTIQKAT